MIRISFALSLAHSCSPLNPINCKWSSIKPSLFSFRFLFLMPFHSLFACVNSVHFDFQSTSPLLYFIRVHSRFFGLSHSHFFLCCLTLSLFFFQLFHAIYLLFRRQRNKFFTKDFHRVIFGAGLFVFFFFRDSCWCFCLKVFCFIRFVCCTHFDLPFALTYQILEGTLQTNPIVCHAQCSKRNEKKRKNEK